MMTFFSSTPTVGWPGAWACCALPVGGHRQGGGGRRHQPRGTRPYKLRPGPPLPGSHVLCAVFRRIRSPRHGLDLGVRRGLNRAGGVVWRCQQPKHACGASPQLEHSWQQLRNKLARPLVCTTTGNGVYSHADQSLLILRARASKPCWWWVLWPPTAPPGAQTGYGSSTRSGRRGAAVLLTSWACWAGCGRCQPRARWSGSRWCWPRGLVLCELLAVFKREAQRWQAWIANSSTAPCRVKQPGAGAAATAVARPDVLFYRTARPNPHTSAIAAGLGAGVVALPRGRAVPAQRCSCPCVRFGVTAALLYTIAVVFLGQAIVELQAAGWPYRRRWQPHRVLAGGTHHPGRIG
jgi:hypothetical protein